MADDVGRREGEKQAGAGVEQEGEKPPIVQSAGRQQEAGDGAGGASDQRYQRAGFFADEPAVDRSQIPGGGESEDDSEEPNHVVSFFDVSGWGNGRRRGGPEGCVSLASPFCGAFARLRR